MAQQLKPKPQPQPNPKSRASATRPNDLRTELEALLDTPVPTLPSVARVHSVLWVLPLGCGPNRPQTGHTRLQWRPKRAPERVEARQRAVRTALHALNVLGSSGRAAAAARAHTGSLLQANSCPWAPTAGCGLPWEATGSAHACLQACVRSLNAPPSAWQLPCGLQLCSTKHNQQLCATSSALDSLGLP